MKINEVSYKWAGALEKRKSTVRIILHHAAAKKCSAADIHAWHIGNGWSGIGYHFLVRKDGGIYRGRPENTVGAHTYGKNYDSIGICFEGNFEEENMNETQKNSGIELVTYLLNRYPGITSVCRHRDFNATACPGKNFPFDAISGKAVVCRENSELKTGGALSLNREPLYAASTAAQKSGTVTGTYYLWDGRIISGRVRITNAKDRVGAAGQVTGWIKAPKTSGTVVHTVVKGDTLSAISAKYGSTVAGIVSANKKAYPKITADYIVVGWKLAIPL